MQSNRLVIGLLCSPLHRLLSGSMLVLRVTGRRSGHAIELPVNYVRDADDERRLWVTSTRERTWWRNLRDGAPVDVYLRGRWHSGTATVDEEPAAVISGLRCMFDAQPGMARLFKVAAEPGQGWRLADLEAAARLRVVIRVTLD